MSFVTFDKFAKTIGSEWLEHMDTEPPRLFRVTAYLRGNVASLLPEHFQRQTFLKSELKATCESLSIDCRIAVQLLALRNAWRGVFENHVNWKFQNEVSKTSVSKQNEEAVSDYLILNSSFWTKHPYINELATFLNREEILMNAKSEEARKGNIAYFSNPEVIASLAKQREKNLQDIEFCIDEFVSEKNNFRSSEEYDVWDAQEEIIVAQRKIAELKVEIEKREAVILRSEKVIRKCKIISKKNGAAKGKGRPVNDEFRVSIGKRFVSKWVQSLMEILQVKSCQKLEQLMSPHATKLETDKVNGVLQEITVLSKATERNWRRWLKGDAIPNYNTFVILMNTKIEFGMYSGKLLQEIATTPDPSKLQALLRFI
ncbi:hypothetical protein [Methylophilus sp. Leaf414]|uniref:hypothetical protein n=1 Tax=Methylophilus sp. Leaf414 TaxID=1736371 RepID=UPI0007005AAE|nr:hypothetical protein [Methylophilus sp. Leaf414]KQT33271.1 hypothetical protein ASG24_13350 [Methylophilus sp. Leaf414]